MGLCKCSSRYNMCLWLCMCMCVEEREFSYSELCWIVLGVILWQWFRVLVCVCMEWNVVHCCWFSNSMMHCTLFLYAHIYIRSFRRECIKRARENAGIWCVKLVHVLADRNYLQPSWVVPLDSSYTNNHHSSSERVSSKNAIHTHHTFRFLCLFGR